MISSMFGSFITNGNSCVTRVAFLDEHVGYGLARNITPANFPKLPSVEN